MKPIRDIYDRISANRTYRRNGLRPNVEHMNQGQAQGMDTVFDRDIDFLSE